MSRHTTNERKKKIEEKFGTSSGTFKHWAKPCRRHVNLTQYIVTHKDEYSRTQREASNTENITEKT